MGCLDLHVQASGQGGDLVHSKVPARPPGSQTPLPIPWRRKHTRQPSSAHLCEWGLGVTLMPGREWTLPGMPLAEPV